MKRLAIILAASMAAGSMGHMGCDKDETSSNSPGQTTGESAGDKVDRALDRTGEVVGNAVDKTVDASKKAGARINEEARDMADSAKGTIRAGDKGTAMAPDAEGIRDVLASVTEAALTENGLDDLTERLVDADRNRIGDAIEADFPEHAALVKQFRADWKGKYGKDFNIKQEEAALPATMFSIRQGEVPRGAAGAEVDVDRDADGSATVDVDAKSGVDSPDTTAADTNRNDPGRNIATVTIKESHGMPSLAVPLIHEAPDFWRIDAPDSVDAHKLRQNVVDHLKAAHAMKDQWPANVNDAYAAVTHHVLMAILDKPVQ